MVQDLLQKIVDEPWVEQLDLDSGERASTSFVSDGHDGRESDIIWKFRRKDGIQPEHVYIHLEFQSRPDPSMPVRVTAYRGLFYQRLLSDLSQEAWKHIPPVLTIIVYNGGEPWRVPTDLGPLIADLGPSAEVYRPQLRYRLVNEAAYDREVLEALNSPVGDLFWIEKSRDWQDVLSGVQRLRQNIPLEEPSLRRAFETWLQKVILPRFGVKPGDTSAILSLKELETMLAENIDRWNRQIREEGRQEGEARVVLRLLRLKFGPLAPEIEERVHSADADRLLEWSERVLAAENLEDIFKG